ncbi:MAG: hypothetical protein ACXWIN_11540 [Burkholderiaceae bacterium]
MDSFSITDKADLTIYYDADSRLYSAEWLAAIGVTVDKFIAKYGDCPSIGFEDNGVAFGGVILDGSDMHIAVLPEYQGKWWSLMSPMFDWIFSHHDPVYAKIHRVNRRSLRFFRRLGAELVTSDDHFYIYMITAKTIPAALQRFGKKRLLSTVE